MANYEVGDYILDLKRFFPDPVFSAITQVRVGSPEIILQETAARKKLTRDGKLTILAEVANREKKMPREFIDEEGNGVARPFLDYVTTLIGDSLPEYARLEKHFVKKML